MAQSDDPLLPDYVPEPAPEPVTPVPGLVNSDRGRNVLGGMSATEDAKAQAAAEEVSGFDLVSGAFDSINAVKGIWDRGERAFSLPQQDPNFLITENKDLYEDLPVHMWSSFDGVGSREEGMQIRASALSDIQDLQVLGRRGLTGFAAMAVAGILDVDLPLTLLTGGLSKGVTGIRAVGQMAKAGAMSGLAVETANTLARPSGDWRNVPLAGLTGLGMGGALGAAAPLGVKAYNASVGKLQSEFSEFLKNGSPRSDKDIRNETFVPHGVWERIVPEDDAAAAAMAQPGQTSVGATQSPHLNFDNTGMSEDATKMVVDSQARLRAEGITHALEIEEPNTPLGKAADSLRRGIAKIPGLRTDFDQLVESGSSIATLAAYDLFESAAGVVRNNRSAAMLDDLYTKRLLSDFLPDYNTAYSHWAKESGISVSDRLWHDKGNEAFSKEVALELQARFYDGQGNPNVNPHVKAAADAHDRGTANAAKVAVGRPNEKSIQGAETITPKAGFMHQRWNGVAITKILKGGMSADDLGAVIGKAYRNTIPGLSPKDALAMGKAVINRARRREEGLDTSTSSLLQSDGRAFLEDALKTNGLPKSQTDRILDALTGKMEERNTPGFTRERNDIDLRQTIDGVHLIDLVDTNLPRVYSRYSRQVAGQSALARKGITSREDQSRLIEAALQERSARGLGENNREFREFLEGMFTYFDGGPIGAGVHPFVQRAKRLTNLSLLNQLGLTQLGETGAIMASVGYETFAKGIKKELADMKAGKTPDVLEEVGVWSGEIGAEHKLFRDDLALDSMRDDAGAQSAFTRMVDGLLARGQRLQGYTSAFYKMRQIQQRLAVSTMADKAIKTIIGKGGKKGLTPERLADIGITPKLQKAIQKYERKGYIEFSKDGYINKLNMDKWNPDHAEDFALALNRHSSQVVQRALAGEGHLWMHSSTGAILGHLRSFPLVAIQKQFIRNMRMADPQTMMLWMYGMATAGTAYSVRQIINGKSENLTPGDIASGAVNYANVSSFIPMMWDPVASLLGQDDLRFNNYRHGVDQGVIPVPPAFSTLNRVSHIPAAVGSAVLPGAEFTNNDIRALQSTPLIGNAYGFNTLFNAMKD